MTKKQINKKLKQEKYNPITVPPDWTDENDLEAFRHQWDGVDKYFSEELIQVFHSYTDLEYVIQKSLNFFAKRPIHKLPGILPLQINWLERKLKTHSKGTQVRKRFAEGLKSCRFALHEYNRILPTYEDGSWNNWTWPLVDLAELLETAAYVLDGSMANEHPDYVSLFQGSSQTRDNEAMNLKVGE